MNLGRLRKVGLRDIWKSESQDFTPWLAREENLDLLGDTIGLDLELEAVEKSVGPFSADILCKETANDSVVLIENQIERTDHTHLGQILTYAAGLNAVTVVWIAQRFTDEHRAALDWLNEITDENINFFGLEVELWKIGDSPAAPKFNVVSKPNEWTRIGVKAGNPGELTDSKQLQLSFWMGFREYAAENAKRIKTTKPLPHHWMNISLGRSGFKLCAIASFWNSATGSYNGQELRAELVLYHADAKGFYAALEQMRPELEAAMGEKFIWHNPEGKNMCRIQIRREADLNNEAKRPEMYAWLTKKLDRMHEVFATRIKTLQPLPIDESDDPEEKG
jgi:hypothetical protein